MRRDEARASYVSRGHCAVKVHTLLQSHAIFCSYDEVIATKPCGIMWRPPLFPLKVGLTWSHYAWPQQFIATPHKFTIRLSYCESHRITSFWLRWVRPGAEKLTCMVPPPHSLACRGFIMAAPRRSWLSLETVVSVCKQGHMVQHISHIIPNVALSLTNCSVMHPPSDAFRIRRPDCLK